MAKRKTKVQKLERRVGNTTADLSDYQRVKSAAGNHSLDCGDGVAKQLRGLDLDAAFQLVAKATGESQRALRKRYAHLNSGMQRMVVGNLLRGATR